jgi:hypothetical protein
VPAHRKQLRVRARAARLPVEALARAGAPQLGPRPDAVSVRALALRPLWIATWPVAGGLVALAAAAPQWTGSGAAALLAGVPAFGLLLCAALGRAAHRRRVAMVLATSTCGFLALATFGGLSGLDALEGPHRLAALYQLGCFALAVVHLGVARFCWTRTNTDGDAAEATAALYDEL